MNDEQFKTAVLEKLDAILAEVKEANKPKPVNTISYGGEKDNAIAKAIAILTSVLSVR